MRSDPRNDRCAPFAKNRLVSGERTNRSYRVVPPRYPGTLFAASLLSLSSLSFENTRSTHTHTRCTVPDHPSTWLLFSNVTKGVVLRAILLLLYTARYILRSGVPEVSYLAKWLLVDALGPDSPLRLTSAFSPFPSWWLAAPVARRLSSVHVLRFVPPCDTLPSIWRPPSLDPDLLLRLPVWCMSCFQWIRCDRIGVLDRMLRGRIDLRGRILELAVPGIVHDPAWVSWSWLANHWPRTVQETVLLSTISTRPVVWKLG